SGSTINISGGIVGDRVDVFAGSTANISGGNVGRTFQAFSGSTVRISGGNVGDNFQALERSVVWISGGTVGNAFDAGSGSMVNISGGVVGDLVDVFSGATVNISGGNVGNEFGARSGSTVNLFGTSFFVNGVELDDLVLGEAFFITGRNTMLTGILADGSLFDFDLNDTVTFGSDLFAQDATLTVTLVPAPGAAGMLAVAGVATALRRRQIGTHADAVVSRNTAETA
ncbi:MAG: hypothetical protein AAF709_25215, partial [Pseudomonadota bacterium]